MREIDLKRLTVLHDKSVELANSLYTMGHDSIADKQDLVTEAISDAIKE